MSGIRKVIINQLWGEVDISWDLSPTVNILTGYNGSGMSTILGIIHEVIHGVCDGMSNFDYDRAEIQFDDDTTIIYKQLWRKIHKSGRLWVEIPTDFNPSLMKMIQHDTGISNINIYNNLPVKYRSHINVELELLRCKYMAFKLNLLCDVISKPLSINFTFNYFMDTVDRLFSNTGKKIDRGNGELSFMDCNGRNKYDILSLSSGEKYLLLMLLNVLLQDNKPSILIVDGPEISLHTEWQHELIDIMRRLNDKCQFILTTHSPSLIMYGHIDEITHIDKIKIK